MKLPFLPLVALLLPLLLPSCIVTSNIGRSIREAGEIHTGVDVFRPVGGVVYQTATQRRLGSSACVIAPEVTYRVYSGTIVLHGLKDNTPPYPVAYDLQPTGQNSTARVNCYQGQPTSLEKIVTHLPAGARAYTTHVEPRDTCYYQFLGNTQPAQEAPLWRHTVALPFDCLIDPALTLTLTAGYWARELISLPFQIVYHGAFAKTTPPAQAE